MIESQITPDEFTAGANDLKKKFAQWHKYQTYLRGFDGTLILGRGDPMTFLEWQQSRSDLVPVIRALTVSLTASRGKK